MNDLENYIKKYLRNKRIAETDAGYSAWLRKNGVTDDVRLTDEAIKRSAENERLIRKRGTQSESIVSSGLGESGYAGYLGDLALERAENSDKRVSAALRAYRDAGYAGFVESRLDAEREAYDYERVAEAEAEAESIRKREEAEKNAIRAEEKKETERKSMLKTARTRLEDSAIIDIERATKLAMDIGLDEADARALAESTTKVARENAISKVLSAIVNKRYTKNQAREYASWLGLSDEDIDALAETAFKNNESPADITSYEEYLEYLENKIKNSN